MNAPTFLKHIPCIGNTMGVSTSVTVLLSTTIGRCRRRSILGLLGRGRGRRTTAKFICLGRRRRRCISTPYMVWLAILWGWRWSCRPTPCRRLGFVKTWGRGWCPSNVIRYRSIPAYCIIIICIIRFHCRPFSNWSTILGNVIIKCWFDRLVWGRYSTTSTTYN